VRDSHELSSREAGTCVMFGAPYVPDLTFFTCHTRWQGPATMPSSGWLPTWFTCQTSWQGSRSLCSQLSFRHDDQIGHSLPNTGNTLHPNDGAGYVLTLTNHQRHPGTDETAQ
jgi:hypothetical protein